MTQELRIEKLEKELAESRKENESLKKKIEEIESQNSFELNQYKTLVNSSPLFITLLKGEDLIIETANDFVLKYWDKTSDIIGKPLIEAHPDIKELGLEDLLLDVYHTGKPYRGYEMPIYITRGDSKELSYFNFVYQPQRDKNGEIYGVAVIAHEVNSQAELHKQLRESEEKYRGLADFMPHKVSITDQDGHSFYYNKSWLDYTGYSIEEIKKKRVRGLLHPEDEDLVIKKGEKSLKDGKPFLVECRFKDKNGNYKWHLCQAVPIKDPEKNTTAWITSCAEIQNIKDDEKQKEDFLKLVSHELKTPVTSIKGYVQLMETIIKNEGAAENFKPYLGRIANQVERLIRLISEILDLSRIEQNELELQKSDFNVKDLVDEVVDDISFTYESPQIFVENCDDCVVSGDKDRIGQVLTNFITNAMKFSPENRRIEINISKIENEYAAVSVKDFGIGISEKDKNLIFNRFFRVEGKNEDTYSGFGIGLYLSKQIIERHQGEIIVNSELGEGSEFIFTLPLQQQN